MDHCRSLDSYGWGLFVCGTENALIRNFTMTDPAGINGVGAMLGCPSGELPVNSTIDAGISDSVIDISASGDRPQTLVSIVNNRNVAYSGTIVSDAPPRPVAVEWNLEGGCGPDGSQGAAGRRCGIGPPRGARGAEGFMRKSLDLQSRPFPFRNPPRRNPPVRTGRLNP
ncbi:hypothetical protein [Methanoculleus chikugoensis]|uniref:hypothetical protein n=1 Tax=Methanoculleus chikugoensis TaxID=118126 RepID=UPI000AD48466|nr:hypothetical protein [Methanoculleus chikugoensis]